MRYITLGEALELYRRVIAQSGGLRGIHDLGALESALAQPRMMFNNQELYPSLVEKAAALSFSLIKNHPFVDGNKRIGHAVMETFLILNGFEIDAALDDQEQIILQIASGELERDALTAWLAKHIIKIG